jgi:hypothetical protein
MAEMPDAVSARYYIWGNSPAYSDTAPTKNGASSHPRKSIKVNTVKSFNT